VVGTATLALVALTRVECNVAAAFNLLATERRNAFAALFGESERNRRAAGTRFSDRAER
jgi:hypothetical protein